MGNNLASKPQAYSDQWSYGKDTRVYGSSVSGSYMATYRQNSNTADSIAFGKGKIQFGVKILQDIDGGAMQGQMYVVNNAGKRLYLTYKDQLRPDASERLMQGKNAGNGPAISITGNPLNPKYHMWYAAGGSDHKDDTWTPIQINSKADITEALTSGMGGIDKGVQDDTKYANYYGQSSINPFGAKVGSDMWTNADRFGAAVTGVVSQLIIPIGESLLDDVIPFASTVLNKTGINAALQLGINSLVKGSQGTTYKSTQQFDPQIANSIKDPRLGGYLNNLQNQSHQFIAKYGDSKYQHTQKMAQDTQSQMLQKGKALAQENEDYYVQSEAQQLTDLSTKLRQMLPKSDSDIFENIKTGLSMAETNQQKMNVINHFSTQIQSQLLPLLNNQPESPSIPPPTVPSKPESNEIQTASAQVGHPSLSINGHDSSPPTKNVISGNPAIFVPIIPM